MLNGFTGIEEIGAFDVYYSTILVIRKFLLMVNIMIKILFFFFYFSKIIMNFRLSVPACTLEIDQSSSPPLSISTMY